MARRKCAAADDAGGPLDKSRVPEAPEGYHWQIHKGKNPDIDWWDLHYRNGDPGGEWVLWMTGPFDPESSWIQAGHPSTNGYWYTSPEEAVAELVGLWRLGIKKK